MIKSNSQGEVRTLIAALGGPEPARREAAVARLNIIGSRAVAWLIPAYPAADRVTQLGILQVLESSADARALPLARLALRSGGDIAVAAVGVLRALLVANQGSGATSAAALETLLSLASDPAREHRTRAAAAEALDTAPGDVRQAVGGVQLRESAEEALWEDAAEGRLPDDPAALREAARSRAGQAPLTVLRRLIETIREQELRSRDADRVAWCALRGSIHQSLAFRTSRIALYDLRETLETAAAPLPASFLAAAQLVGDASCLEALAAAYTRTASRDERWRHQLTQTFHALARRARFGARHAAMRRALSKAPELGAQ